MSETVTWSDWRGRKVSREVNLTVNAADFLGTAIYPWLVVAANPGLSAVDISRYLEIRAEETDGVFRPASWIRKRRWMFKPPGTIGAPGAKRDADGQEARAVRVMRENPELSSQKLSEWLGECGIVRSPSWVREHRCDLTAFD